MPNKKNPQPEMTPAALLALCEEVERLAAGATPGPWKVATDTCDCEYPCSHGPFPEYIYSPTTQVEVYEGYTRSMHVADFGDSEGTCEDAAFIAACRTAAPALERGLRMALRVVMLMMAGERGSCATCAHVRGCEGPGPHHCEPDKLDYWFTKAAAELAREREGKN
jgi:hypothetical protein